MDGHQFDHAVTQLKQVYASSDKHPEIKEMTDKRDEVLAQYQPIFSANALPNLTASDFQSFLLFKNNHHWTGLHRQGPQICKNMDGLRGALLGLHNASKPIEDRFDAALQSVNHLGKGILSAVLHVMYPNEFGVWNRTSEAGLKLLDVWPEFERGVSSGKRYQAINDVLHHLKDSLGVDLWVLDSLLWAATQNSGVVEPPVDETDPVRVAEVEEGELQKFGLEKYLHEFLRDNWDATELGKSWEIYGEAGEDAGYKYSCGLVGQIDILARHKNGRDWLVVELKRDQSGDSTVGQLLRYMGFVRHSLAKADEYVFGLIIARSLDEKLHYAVSNLPNVAVHAYSVEFKLAPSVKGDQKLPFKLATLSDLVVAP
jgi:hypothetical protein